MTGNRYAHIQDKVKAGEAVYMPYVLVGYPTLDASITAAKALIDGGADGLELGIPFRDPVADGPVIQDAANIALDNGFKVNDLFKFISEIRSYGDTVPFTIMTYYNVVLAKGTDRFIEQLKEAGADGILIPDLPPEHADEVHPITRKNSIELIFIAAPTSSKERYQAMKPYAGGFVYVVTKMGITGMNENYDDSLEKLFIDIKSNFDIPAIAGFGISTPGNAKDMVGKGANGVIIGSKIISLCNEGFKDGELCSARLIEHTEKIQDALKAS